MSIKKVAQGLLFGSLVGGTLGLLLAPKSGRKLRAEIQQEIDDATFSAEQMNASVANFSRALSQLTHLSKEILPHALKDTEQMIKDFTFQAEPRIDAINAQTQKIAARLKDAK